MVGRRVEVGAAQVTFGREPANALAVLCVVGGGAFLARQSLHRPPALEVGQAQVGPVIAAGKVGPEDSECSPTGEGLTFGIGLTDVTVTLDENGGFELTHNTGSGVGTPETKVRCRAGSGQLELSGSMSSEFEEGSPTGSYLGYRKSSTSCTLTGRSPLVYSESWGLRVFRTTTPIVAECKGVSEVPAGGDVQLRRRERRTAAGDGAEAGG